MLAEASLNTPNREITTRTSRLHELAENRNKSRVCHPSFLSNQYPRRERTPRRPPRAPRPPNRLSNSPDRTGEKKKVQYPRVSPYDEIIAQRQNEMSTNTTLFKCQTERYGYHGYESCTTRHATLPSSCAVRPAARRGRTAGVGHRQIYRYFYNP
ncbi:hypothetical protein EVAR_47659_1 [Eumeta japonica]|uniref:Uncharacterized protein n=1 Tax=Eumeta variegata TaxID=151549 RepID=A0A4C1XZU6_EUMVA|nr:hypothetical protein EVAR_47659_1 [Eumeta japonica]